jgi:hypothetical protein
MIRSPSVPGHRPVLDLGRPLTDHDHVRDPAAALIGAAFRAPDRPPGPQTRGQLPAQRPTGLDIQRLVDRLVRHVHLRPVSELGSQRGRDLLRRPAITQHRLHPLTQLCVDHQLGRLRSPRVVLSAPLRPRGPVVQPGVMRAPVPGDLAGDRRAMSAQPTGDHRRAQASGKPERDLLTLGEGQEPPRARPGRPRTDTTTRDQRTTTGRARYPGPIGRDRIGHTRTTQPPENLHHRSINQPSRHPSPPRPSKSKALQRPHEPKGRRVAIPAGKLAAGAATPERARPPPGGRHRRANAILPIDASSFAWLRNRLTRVTA